MRSTSMVLPLLLCATLASASPARSHRPSMHPQITASTARATALARVPGARVKSQELEREHGRLIWSFDLATAGSAGIDEVNVDARTGQVVAVQHEGPKAERRERAQERREAAKGH